MGSLIYYKISNKITTKLLVIFTVLVFNCSVKLAQESPKLCANDLHVLVDIKNSLTDLPGSSFFASWDFSGAQDPCSTFEGVTCDVSLTSPANLRVTVLELGGGLEGSLGLAGMLPESITGLTELTQLILNPGMVTGPIPSQLGRLTGLRVLFMSHNRLTGPIPGSVSRLAQLHTLDLSFNHLTGFIPPGLLTDLTQLKVLVMAGNQLGGELPDSTRSLGLLHLDIKSNCLVGPIPTTLPLTLRYISLSQNLMWGPINGTILESLPDLSYLDLSYNKFSGPIPLSLLRPTLSTLLLNHNNLSGHVSVSSTVSREPTSYPAGSVIDLSHNNLYGTLPEAAAGAENIYFNNNRFSGPVPAAYISGIKATVIKTLYLQHNFLNKFPKSLGSSLPDNVDVCLAYNCMVPPLGLDTCPSSAGTQLSRPASQCLIFHNDPRKQD